ncbi:MAG: Nif3-like dinuclear metal center hexameric protein [Deltaproteobacteria bacterium]|nr:MAG: Nif3-like dinuclear metal center hexameric protein [Deltaproteobacteria bacterium]
MVSRIPTVRDLLGLLDQLAPFERAESWDNPGLQVGDLSQTVTTICVALDPSLESLKGCMREGGQLLLTHHPLIFKPLSSLDVRNYPTNVLLGAAREGIAVIAAHTNLDMADRGINQMLAEDLGLRDIAILKEMGEKGEWGLGRIGSLSEPRSLSSFVRTLKTILGTEHLRVTGDLHKEIRHVAVVGGSGGDLVRDASEKGAELLLTGDVGHHDALDARTLGIAVVDGGHFLTERLALRKFAAFFQGLLKKEQWDVKIIFLEDETDPLHWV